MRIRELTIENFRKFRRPITLAGFSDGLNLVCEPNETGKSTVLDALRAALFERHGSKSDRIRSFRPHGDDVAPTITVTFEIGDECWSLEKRFLMSPSVTLEGPGGRFQSDAAEEKLQSLLGFARAGNKGADDESRGALGLLWVEQGAWSLAAPGQAARKTLEDVLAGEVGAVTGGRRTAAVVQAVDKAIAELLTPTGKPARRLQAAQEAFEAAKSAQGVAQDELAAYEGVLGRLESRRNELRRLLRDIEDPEFTAQGASLDRDLVRARSAGQELRTAGLFAQQATAERLRHEAHKEARIRLRAAQSDAQARLRTAKADQATHLESIAEAKQSEAGASASLTGVRDALRKAETARDKALAARAAGERDDRLRASFARLDQAAPLAARVEDLRARAVGNLVTAEALEGLEALERGVEQARAAAAAGAATLRIALDPQTRAARLNGDLLAGSATLSVTTQLTLELPGVASIEVEPPPSGEGAQVRLRAAERERDDGLARLGVTSISEARQKARARAEDEQALSTASAQIEAICVADPVLDIDAGFAALKAALADAKRPASAAPPAPAGADTLLSESAFQDLRAEERRATAKWESALAALQALEVKQVELASEVARHAAEERRQAQELALDVESLSDEALGAAILKAIEIDARATVDLATAQRAAEGLDEDELGRRKEAWARQGKKLQDDRIDLLQDIARLEVEAKTRGSAGPATRAQEAAEELEYAQTIFDRLREEAETLQLLKSVIAEAQQEAARRYLTPIKMRVQPYVSRLLPAADLAFGEDYRPHRLVRGGREELAEDLSKGTQEQLAILTRLAFADLLLEKGKPASLVLDDALVFADDDRFETMTDILSEAAQRMQVIVLSCRTSAYRRVEANKIVIG